MLVTKYNPSTKITRSISKPKPNTTSNTNTRS